MLVLAVECERCDATGVYRNSYMPEGVGFVCGDCGGSGRKKISFVTFSRRKRRGDISKVYMQTRFFSADIMPGGDYITYSEFASASTKTD